MELQGSHNRLRQEGRPFIDFAIAFIGLCIHGEAGRD